MLLRNAEVQYVADMPLDNRTVDQDQFAASAASGRLKGVKWPPPTETI
jgi:hypothetical protein